MTTLLLSLACGGSAGSLSGGQASATTLDPNWYNHPAATASATASVSAPVKIKSTDSDYVYDAGTDQVMAYQLTALSPALVFDSFAQRAHPGKQFIVVPLKLTLLGVTYPNMTNVVSTPAPQGFALLAPIIQCTVSDQLLRQAQSETPRLDYVKEDAGFYTLLGQALHLKADIPSIPAKQMSGSDSGALILLADSGVTQVTLDCKMMNWDSEVHLQHTYKAQSVVHWTPSIS
jgi:hypothetical protein